MMSPLQEIEDLGKLKILIYTDTDVLITIIRTTRNMRDT